MSDVIDTHYRRLAGRYDEFLVYSPDFVRTLTRRMIEMLALEPDDLLVDLGCGTGIYSRDILLQLPLRRPVIGIDPFPEMLDRIPAEAPIERVVDDAESFARRDTQYDKLLMKEAVHHVEDRRGLFEGLYRQVRPGGRILLVHVPPKVGYPLFDAALERCERWHADPNKLESLAAEAGFQVQRDAVTFPHAIPREVYLSMVAHRYMSVLSSFEDEEIRAGLEEIERRYAEIPTLEFVDHFDYIAGTRPA